jgi:hypothetical protein
MLPSDIREAEAHLHLLQAEVQAAYATLSVLGMREYRFRQQHPTDAPDQDWESEIEQAKLQIIRREAECAAQQEVVNAIWDRYLLSQGGVMKFTVPFLSILVLALCATIGAAQPKPPAQPPTPGDWVKIAEGQWMLKPQYPNVGGGRFYAKAPSFVGMVEQLEAKNAARKTPLKNCGCSTGNQCPCDCTGGCDCPGCTCAQLKWYGPDEKGYYFLWQGNKVKAAYHKSWGYAKQWEPPQEAAPACSGGK